MNSAAAGRVVAEGAAAVLLLALLIGAGADHLQSGTLADRPRPPRLGPRRPRPAQWDWPGRDGVGVLATVFDEMADNVERTVRIREVLEQKMRQLIGDASHELRTAHRHHAASMSSSAAAALGLRRSRRPRR